MWARRIASAVLVGVSLTACGTTSSAISQCCAPPPTQRAVLHTAVLVFSNSYLTGKPLASYHLISYRCRARIPISRWTSLVAAAEHQYGSELPFKTFRAQIHGNRARVTYTFAVRALDQTSQPWVEENGTWHKDDC